MTSSHMTVAPKLLRPSSELWVPHGYQKKAVKHLLSNAAAALFLDPGLGKSSIVLEAIKALLNVNEGITLVIAPVRVCYAVWDSSNPRSELRKWKNFHKISSVVLHGPKKDELIHQRSDIYVVNPEGLQWLIKSGGLALLLKRGLKNLVVDELSKFKNHGSVRYKALKPWLPKFKRRWGLTGSPAANGLLGLFGQCYVLDLGKALGRYVTHYRYRYFVPTGFGGYTWVPQEWAEQEIYKAVSRLALRMSAEDHLALPPLINHPIMLDLPEDLRETYDTLEEEFIAKVGKKIITAKNGGVASGKLRQLCGGGLYISKPDQKRDVLQLHDLKSEALEDLLEELQGQQVLVAYDFDQDLDRLKALYKRMYGNKEDLPYIGEGVSMKRGIQLQDAWNRKEIPWMAGHPQSIGHGLNMQEGGAHLYWYTLPWDYELYDQFIRRIRRQGTKHLKIWNHKPKFRNTIDEAVDQLLNGKRRGQDALFEAVKILNGMRKQRLN